jgi:hypothetical protein
MLFAWGHYLSDFVNSRVGEFVWTSTPYDLDEVEHSEWLAQRFLKMQSQWRQTKQVEAKLEAQQFTAHDKTIRERLELSEEDLLTRLTLVARYSVELASHPSLLLFGGVESAARAHTRARRTARPSIVPKKRIAGQGAQPVLETEMTPRGPVQVICRPCDQIDVSATNGLCIAKYCR